MGCRNAKARVLVDRHRGLCRRRVLVADVKRRIYEPVVTQMPCGKIYPSMRAVAKEYGVTVGTVGYHMDNGSLDKIGTGTTKRQPYIYEGIQYPSLAACARAHGVHTNTFNWRLERGRDPVTGQK